MLTVYLKNIEGHFTDNICLHRYSDYYDSIGEVSLVTFNNVTEVASILCISYYQQNTGLALCNKDLWNTTGLQWLLRLVSLYLSTIDYKKSSPVSSCWTEYVSGTFVKQYVKLFTNEK